MTTTRILLLSPADRQEISPQEAETGSIRKLGEGCLSDFEPEETKIEVVGHEDPKLGEYKIGSEKFLSLLERFGFQSIVNQIKSIEFVGCKDDYVQHFAKRFSEKYPQHELDIIVRHAAIPADTKHIVLRLGISSLRLEASSTQERAPIKVLDTQEREVTPEPSTLPQNASKAGSTPPDQDTQAPEEPQTPKNK